MSKKNKQPSKALKKSEFERLEDQSNASPLPKSGEELEGMSAKVSASAPVRYLRKMVDHMKQLLDAIWRQKDTIRDIIKNRHRFVVMDSQTYKEKISFQLTGINLFVVLGISMIVLVLLTTLIIAFTPLREFIPGYTNNKLAEQSYENAMVIDSLSQVLVEQERMITDIKAIIMGQDPALLHKDSVAHDTTAEGVGRYEHSREDSLLRREVESVDKYSIRASSTRANDNQAAVQNTPVSMQLFFSPLKGKVVSVYDAKVNHFGIDIAGSTGDVVKAILSGTVIMTQFTVDDGYVVAVQHGGNIISIYKQVNSVLKKEGDVVRAGEPVAFVGESGNAKIGPHLHFELWMGGKPVNPLKYISF